MRPPPAVATLGKNFEEVSNQVMESANDLAATAMAAIKKYPLHTALAAGVAGLFAGAVIARK